MTTPVGNSAANASSNGPTTGYTLDFLLLILFILLILFMLIIVINMNMCTFYDLLITVMIILLFSMFNFEIKTYQIMPKFLKKFTQCY
jgi:hypothetical protein